MYRQPASAPRSAAGPGLIDVDHDLIAVRRHCQCDLVNLLGSLAAEPASIDRRGNPLRIALHRNTITTAAARSEPNRLRGLAHIGMEGRERHPCAVTAPLAIERRCAIAAAKNATGWRLVAVAAIDD